MPVVKASDASLVSVSKTYTVVLMQYAALQVAN